VRLDEPRETQQFEQVRPDREGLRPPAPAHAPVESWRAPSWENPTREAAAAGSRPWDAPLPSWEAPYVRPAAPPPPPAVTPPPSGDDWWTARPVPEALARDHWRDHEAAEPRSRHSADEFAGPPATTISPIAPSSIARPPVAEPPPSPLDWLAARSLFDEPLPRTSLPEVPPRRRSTDIQADVAPNLDARTEQRPAFPPPAHPEPPTEGNRLAEILAENGVTPTSGGRRRRRYRDEDEPDDVLARVLGRN
jgi:hypothetical protein